MLILIVASIVALICRSAVVRAREAFLRDHQASAQEARLEGGRRDCPLLAPAIAGEYPDDLRRRSPLEASRSQSGPWALPLHHSQLLSEGQILQGQFFKMRRVSHLQKTENKSLNMVVNIPCVRLASQFF
jgi:hypothetical protein